MATEEADIHESMATTTQKGEGDDNKLTSEDGNVNAVIQGNFGTIEGESFLESPSVSKVAFEETSRLNDKYQAAEVPQEKMQLIKNEILKGEELGDQCAEYKEVYRDENIQQTAEEPNACDASTKHEESSYEEAVNASAKEQRNEAFTKAGSDGNTEAEEGGKSYMSNFTDRLVQYFSPQQEGDEKHDSTLGVTPEKTETETSKECVVEKQISTESPESIFEETIKDQKVSADDIDKTEVAEERNLSTVNLIETTQGVEVEKPNKNAGDIDSAHPLVVEAIQVGGEKHDETSASRMEEVHEENGIPLCEEIKQNEDDSVHESQRVTMKDAGEDKESGTVTEVAPEHKTCIGKAADELNWQEENKTATTSAGDSIEKQVIMGEYKIEDQSMMSIEKEEIAEIPNKDKMVECMAEHEANKGHETIGESKSIEKQSTEENIVLDVHSLTVEGEKVANTSRDDEKDVMESKEEATLQNLKDKQPTEKSHPEAIKDEAVPNEECHALTTPNESNECIVEKSSSGNEENEEIEKVVLPTAKSKEETTLTEAKAKDIMLMEDSDRTFDGENSLTAEPAETRVLDVNEDHENPISGEHGVEEADKKIEHEEVATAETPSDDKLEEDDNVSSTLSMKDHYHMTVDAIKGTCVSWFTHEEKPMHAETIEEKIVKIEKSNSNEQDKEPQDEDQDTELKNEKGAFGLEEKLNKDIEKTEMPKDKEPMDPQVVEDTFGNGKSVDEASEIPEACFTHADTENNIQKQDDIVKNFEGSSRKDVDIEKVLDELNAAGHSHGSEASEKIQETKENEEIEETVKLVPQQIFEPVYMGDEAIITVGENPEQTIPAEKSEMQLQVPCTALVPKEKDESTKKDEAEADTKQVQQASGMVSQFSTTEQNTDDLSVFVEREAGEVEEAEASDGALASRDRNFNENRDTRESLIEENTDACKMEDQFNEVDSMTHQETSDVVSQLSSIEKENANVINAEKKVNEVEVEETKNSDAVFVSKDEDVEEIHDTRTSLTSVQIDACKMENETKGVPETIPDPTCLSSDAVADGETLMTEKSQKQLQVPSSALLSKEDDHEAPITNERIEEERTVKEETEVNTMKFEESASMVSQYSTIEPENAEDTSMIKEKETNEVEVKEIKSSHAVFVSEEREVEHNHEKGTTLALEKTDSRKIEKEINEVQGVEAVADGQIILDQTTEITDKLQVPSTALSSKDDEHDAKVKIDGVEEESTKKETEIDTMKLEENSSLVSRLSTIQRENSEDASEIVEKEVNEVEETNTSPAILVSADREVENINGNNTNLTLEKTDSCKMEKEIIDVYETTPDAEYQCVEPVADGEIILDQTTEIIEETLKVPSTALLSKEDNHEAAITIEKLEEESTKQEATRVHTMVSPFSTIQPENACDMNVTVGKEAGPVEVEETKTSDAVTISEDMDPEQILETRRSSTSEKTDTCKMEKEIKGVPETILDPKYQGVEAVANDEIALEQTTEKLEEQLQAPSLTSEKISTCKIENEIKDVPEAIPDPEYQGVEAVANDEIALEQTTENMEEQLQATSLTSNKTDTCKMEKEIKGVPEAISDPEYQGVEAVADGEIILNQTTEITEEKLQAPSTDFLSKEDKNEATITIEKVEDDIRKKDEAEGDSMKQETSEMGSQITTIEPENMGDMNVTLEKEADKVEETKTSDEVSILEEEIKDVSETIPDPKVVADDEFTSDRTTEKLQEQLQVQSTALLSKEADNIMTTTTTEIDDKTTKGDETEVDTMKLAENSSNVSHISTTETENAEVKEKETDKVEVEGMETSNVAYDSKGRDDEEIREPRRSSNVEKTDATDTEEINEVSKTELESKYNGLETVANNESNQDQGLTAAKSEEQPHVPSPPFLPEEEDRKVPKTINKLEDDSTMKEEIEVDTMKLDENPCMVSQLSTVELEIVKDINVNAEKVALEVEERKSSDSVFLSDDRDIEVIHEIGTIKTVEKTDASEEEEDIEQCPTIISEAEYHGLVSKKEDHEIATTIEVPQDKSTKEDDTEVDRVKLQDATGTVSQLSTSESENQNEMIVDVEIETVEVEVEAKANKTDTAHESTDQGIKEILETDASPAIEKIVIKEVGKEISEVMSESKYQDVEEDNDDKINPDQKLPAVELGNELQVPSSLLLITDQDSESTSPLEDKNVEGNKTVRDSIKLEETPDVNEHADIIENVESVKADALEAVKSPNAVDETKDQGAEGIHEVESIQAMGKTDTDNRLKAYGVPEEIYEPKYKGFETVGDDVIASDPNLPAETLKYQFQEPSDLPYKEEFQETVSTVESTKIDDTQIRETLADQLATRTEERCAYNEEPRELEVSNLKLKLFYETQDILTETPKEEQTGIKEVSCETKYVDSALECEKATILSTSEGTSEDVNIPDLGYLNKNADDLPNPQSTVKEVLTAEIGELCEAASSPEFEKPEKDTEYASEVHNPEAFALHEETISDEKQLEDATTKLKDTEKQSKETIVPSGKIKEENNVYKDTHQVIPDEERIAEGDTEDELRQKEYPGEKKYEVTDIKTYEIPSEELSKEHEKASTDKNVKEIAVEDRAFDDYHQVLAVNLIADECLSPEVGKGKSDTATELDFVAKGDDMNSRETVEEAPDFHEEVNSTGTVLVKSEYSVGVNHMETGTVKDELNRKKQNDLPLTDAPGKQIGENYDEVSDPAANESIHKIINTREENKDTATTETSISESLKENEQPDPRYEAAKAVADDEFTSDRTTEKLQEQLQVQSKEVDNIMIATTTEIGDETTKREETQVDTMKLAENSFIVSHISTIEPENEEVKEKETGEVEVEGTKNLNAAFLSKGKDDEDFQEPRRSSNVEKTDASETEEINEEQPHIPSPPFLPEEKDRKVPNTINKIEDDSPMKDEIEVDTLKLDENSCTVSQLPTVELEIVKDMNVNAEKEALEDEERKPPDTVFLSDNRDVEMIHEIGTFKTVEKTDASKEEEDVDRFPKTISEAEYQGNDVFTPDQDSGSTSTLEDKNVEGNKIVRESIMLEETSDMNEHTDIIERVENVNADELEAAKSSNTIDKTKDQGVEGIHEVELIKTMGKTDTDTLRTYGIPEFEKPEKDTEHASKVHNPEAFTIHEETISDEKKFDDATTKLKDTTKESEEASEANETTENQVPSEKIKDENNVYKDTHLVIPDEEKIAEGDTGDDLRQKDYPGEKIADECLSPEVGKGKSVETDTKLDLVAKGDDMNSRETVEETPAFHEEGNSAGTVLVKNEYSLGANHTETGTVKDELNRTNQDDTPVTDAPGKQIGESFDEVSDPSANEPHKIFNTREENKDSATTETSISESLEENEKPGHIPLESAYKSSDVTEGLNLKDQELPENEPSPSSPAETSQREKQDREDVKTSNNYNFVHGMQATEEVSISEGEKSIKCEEELKENEEQIQHSTGEIERTLDEDVIHTPIAVNKETKTQVQHGDLAKVSETNNDIQKAVDTSLPKSDGQNPTESDPYEKTEATISNDKDEIALVQPVTTVETFLQVEDKRIDNVLAAGREENEVDFGDKKKMDAEFEETTVLTEGRNLTVDTKELQTEQEEKPIAEEGKTDEGDDDKKADTGSDALVETSRDMDVKVTHKKSHNILSGVGSKVKHSIAKVKKAITGKSSHSKQPLQK